MAPDPTAFIVVPVEATMTVLWRAMRAIRSNLAISRVHWHPDERFRDGRHFRVEIPVAQLADPQGTQVDVQLILQAEGASLTY
jgi:hypothetical protein